jgi:hypothetical protein
LRLISRLTVEGERRSEAAIDRIEWPATKPREISSRSARLSARGERLLGGGRIPPLRAKMPLIDE